MLKLAYYGKSHFLVTTSIVCVCVCVFISSLTFRIHLKHDATFFVIIEFF